MVAPTVNISADNFNSMITDLSKTLSRTPVTETNHPISGEQYLTDGTPGNISGIFYRKEDSWSQDKEGLFQGADGIIMIKTDVTLNKNDKIGFDSQTYRVHSVVTRYMGSVALYKMARVFKT